jgi:hypothetical protein
MITRTGFVGYACAETFGTEHDNKTAAAAVNAQLTLSTCLLTDVPHDTASVFLKQAHYERFFIAEYSLTHSICILVVVGEKS